MIYDAIIVGAGPAGLSAAIYAQRAKLSILVIESNYVSGGQIVNTTEVDNYPGLLHISGMQLGEDLEKHATFFGTKIVRAGVTGFRLSGKTKVVETAETNYEGRCVVLAMGAKYRKLGVPGEEALAGSGVSYCATCDGAFFKDKVVTVVGGGDTAIGDAIFLARICRKVYLIHRRDALRAAPILQEGLRRCQNVEILWNSTVKEIRGRMKVEEIAIDNVKTRQIRSLHTDGVFVAIGNVPNTTLVSGQLDLDASGYIVAAEDGRTNICGVFAAGDIRTKQLRQVITAVSDGANCVTSIEDYLLRV